MRNDPYVVVISGLVEPETEFLMNVLDDLEVPSFFPQRDIQPGENSLERLRAELNKADLVLVGTNPPQEDLRELENTRSRRALDAAFTMIPVVLSSESKPDLPWLQGVKPLVYEVSDPAKTVTSLVNILIPHITKGERASACSGTCLDRL